MAAKGNNQETIFIGHLTPSPLGPIWVAISKSGLVAVEINHGLEAFRNQLERMGYGQVKVDQSNTAPVLQEISEYLDGKRQDFTMPIDWSGLTPFQVQVLRATANIPYGQVATYGEIARQLGKPQAARAVGRAEATNPMPLVIPCHRVVGADGSLHGYGAGEGLATKAWLLDLERRS